MNPFATFGEPVYGPAFVGRQRELHIFRERVLDSPAAGCVALVGIPRIGKSSMAWHALMTEETRQHYPNLIPLWVNLATCPDLEALLRHLVRLACEELDDRDRQEVSLQKLAETILTAGREWMDLQHDTQRFFTLMKRAGWRVVVVLDEFDAARMVFRRQHLAFQTLRELANNPRWKICIVTTSRRPLAEIASQSQADESTFRGIFEEIAIRSFDGHELDMLLEKAAKAGVEVGPELRGYILERSGGHPYLASCLLSAACRHAMTDPPVAYADIDREAGGLLLDYYEELIRLLREDDRYSKLLEILLGPTVSATHFDAEELDRLGVICENGRGGYAAFSTHFAQYLQVLYRSVDFWPLWRETETRLRALVKDQLTRQYGENWPARLAEAKPNLADKVGTWRAAQEKERRTFGSLASVDLLDFTYPMDLFDLIRTHWSSFQPLLGRDVDYWAQRFRLLAKVRNPMAHNRSHVVIATERQVATGFCTELLGLLRAAGTGTDVEKPASVSA